MGSRALRREGLKRRSLRKPARTCRIRDGTALTVHRRTASPRASPRYGCLHHPLRLGCARQRRGPRSQIGSPEGRRNAAFSTPSRGGGGRSGAELVACKTELLSPLAPHLSSNEGNFPFEKSKTGLGEALVAGLSASLQRPLAPLRHLWWDVAAAWYCRESHLRRYRGLLRMQEASARGRWIGRRRRTNHLLMGRTRN